MALPVVASCALPPSFAWKSLVSRSIEASETLAKGKQAIDMMNHVRWLLEYSCLDDFLAEAPKMLMFWFFLRRDAFLSQKTMMKWDRNALDDYVLLPGSNGFVSRSECFFVSHYWRTSRHPDPDGEYLRRFQAELQSQSWSYVWVDWMCMPQEPRSHAEELYFMRSLETVSAIIRNCGFIWYYPPYEARLWILYEVAEYVLTSSVDLPPTADIREFKNHVHEIVQTSVRSVLDKYSYRSRHERDRVFLTSWLEILVLLKKLHIDIIDMRRLMDHLTWSPSTKRIFHNQIGLLELNKFEGTLIYHGQCYTFTPFPTFVSPPIVVLSVC